MITILPFVLFLVFGFTSIVINKKNILSYLFVISSSLALICGLYLMFTVKSNITYEFGGFSKEIGIEYLVNPFKLMVLNTILFVIFAFSIFFVNFVRNFEKHFNFSNLFCIIQVMCGALVGIIFTNDLFNFYIFFELLAICSYVLISFGGKNSSFASFNYLLLGVFASGFLVLGIGFLYFSTGFLNITKIIEFFAQNPKDLTPAFIFISIGFLIKLGIFPFSFWVGLVYRHFPSSVIPLYSGVVSLATLFGFFNFLSSFFLNQIAFLKPFVMVVSIAGILVFSVFSLIEINVRKILAYSTISQVSYAIFPIFFGDAELTKLSFIHIISNGISKFVLFIIVFEVIKEKLPVVSCFDGLAKRSFFLAFFVLFFFANIIGLPVTLGFFTKFSIILNLFKLEEYLFIIIMLAGAVMNFIYFWKIANRMFFAESEEGLLEVSILTKISICLGAFAVFFLVIFLNKLPSPYLV